MTLSDQNQMLQHEDGPHTVLVESGEKFTFGHGLKPECAKYLFEVLSEESVQHEVITFCHPPTI